MPGKFLCRAFLPHGREAVAYDAGPITEVFIQHQDAKEPEHQFHIDGQIVAMSYIGKCQHLAIYNRQNKTILTYDLANRKNGLDFSFPFDIQSFTTTETSLIVGTGGRLVIYECTGIVGQDHDWRTWTVHQSLKSGNFISGLSAVGDYILCDVHANTHNYLQAKLFDNKGTFLRFIGVGRFQVNSQDSFIDILEANTCFIAIPKDYSYQIEVYDFGNEQINRFEIPNSYNFIFICAFKGRIAVCSGQDKQYSVKVYHPLNSSELFSGVTSQPIRTKEEMYLFVPDQEKKNISELGKTIMGALGSIGLFGDVAHLIQDYVVTSAVLPASEVETILPKLQ